MAKMATRKSFGQALLELGGIHRDIVVLDADLSKSTMSKMFADKYPDRFFEMGISEANMIGAGAGLALAGKKPFICSFACFVTGRYDTIRISVAYSEAPVRIVGTHAGIGIGEDGNSQMGLEDIGLMRGLPHMTVIQPADDIETRLAVRWMVENDVPSYLRLTRQNVTDVNGPGYKFTIGKAVELVPGKDITIMASGGPVHHAVAAAELLKKDGISAGVVNIHTIKPIDAEAIRRCARETGHIVTVEDHNIIGGLGTAVAEVLAESGAGKLTRHGLRDAFGESGTCEDLYKKYRFDPEGIAEVVKEALGR
ncbi:transketolase family protein [bacterium]|nr:transketolase family protein [bacterium]